MNEMASELDVERAAPLSYAREALGEGLRASGSGSA